MTWWAILVGYIIGLATRGITPVGTGFWKEIATYAIAAVVIIVIDELIFKPKLQRMIKGE